jgi:hypothetical protein
METLRALEQITNAMGFVFSGYGSTQNALAFFQEHQIAYSDDERWLE